MQTEQSEVAAGDVLNMINAAKKLPIGLSSFEKIIAENYLYVDKTKIIANLCGNGGYFFLSRPRRFGKTLLLDTLEQAFSGKKELFKDLYLENNWDWNKKYPVIRISFSGDSFTNLGTLEKKIDNILNNIAALYSVELFATLPGEKLGELITKLQIKNDNNVVVLIDEYDEPILDAIDNTEIAIKNRETLKGFYGILKDHDANLRMVFVTGVTKFAKAGIFSQLNNLNDITFNKNYADICGYTQNDIETTFKPYLEVVDLVKLKYWYNGYNFLGGEKQKVYNPFDILLFISNGKIYKNYWFETGTPTFLIKMLQTKNYNLSQLENMIVDEMLLNSFDVDNLTLETLLLQSGYLTITEVVDKPFGGADYRINYPNHEVRQSLNSALMHYLSPDKSLLSNININLAKAFINKDFNLVKEVLSSFLSGIPCYWYGAKENTMNNYEGYYCVVIYSILNAIGIETIPEGATSLGRIDMSLDILKYRIIMEFKMKKYGNAASAIQQIKDKKYADKYKIENRPIYLLGISFDDELKNIHDFAVEELKN